MTGVRIKAAELKPGSLEGYYTLSYLKVSLNLHCPNLKKNESKDKIVL